MADIGLGGGPLPTIDQLKSSQGFRQYDPGVFTNDSAYAQGMAYLPDTTSALGYRTAKISDLNIGGGQQKPPTPTVNDAVTPPSLHPILTTLPTYSQPSTPSPYGFAGYSPTPSQTQPNAVNPSGVGPGVGTPQPIDPGVLRTPVTGTSPYGSTGYSPTPSQTQTSGVPQLPSATQTGTYNDALNLANQFSQYYEGAPLTQAQIDSYVARYGPGTPITGTMSTTGASLMPILQDIIARSTRGGTPTYTGYSPTPSQTQPPTTTSPYPFAGGVSNTTSSFSDPSRITVDPGTGTGTPTPTPTPTTSAPSSPNGMDPRLAQLYAKYNVTPGDRGSGFADWQYWTDVANQTGDWNYVLGRLEADLAGTGTDGRSGPTSGPSGTGTPTSDPGPMNFDQALAYVSKQLGYTPSSDLINSMFQKFGGSPSDTFTAASLAPVLQYLNSIGKGPATGTPDPKTPPLGTQPPTTITPDPNNPYQDPSTQFLQNFAMTEIQNLLSGRQDPYQAAYGDLLNKQISDLQQPVFSQGDLAGVRASFMNQLEANRRSELQAAQERMGAMGASGSSGTVQGTLNQINTSYDQQEAQAENNLATYQTQADQQRALEAVSLGAQRSATANQDYLQNLQQQQQALSLAGFLADLPTQRLQVAEQAAGMGTNPSAFFNSLIQLSTNAQQAYQTQLAQQQQYAMGLGQILGGIGSNFATAFNTPQQTTSRQNAPMLYTGPTTPTFIPGVTDQSILYGNG